MQVLWDRSPLAASEVVDALAGRTDWRPRTIKTMLNRLVKKGALRFAVDGNRYLYRPKVTRHACVRREVRLLEDRVFGAGAASMLGYLVRQHRLSRSEIEELEQILDEQEE